MCKERATFVRVVVPLIAALALMFFACSSQLAYAKGVQNSRNSSDNSSDRSSSSNSSDKGSQSQGNSSNNSSRGNSSYGSNQSSESRSDNSSNYRSNNSSETRQDNSSNYRSNNSNESRRDNSPNYRSNTSNESRSDNSSTYRSNNSNQSKGDNSSNYKADDSRHKPPPSESRRDTSSNVPKYESDSRQSPIFRSNDTNNSKSNNSTYRSSNSGSSSQQDDPRHKPPSAAGRSTSSGSQYRSDSNPPPVVQRPGSPIIGGQKGHASTFGTVARVQDRSETRSSVSPAGAFRKDYENLAQIWKSRRERTDSSRDRDHNGGTRVNININFFPGRYNYYSYDYRPGFAYPSPFCYYYGMFPPYIFHNRVYYIHRIFPAVVYVEIPIVVFTRENVFYDSYYSPEWRYQSLSAALRDIERAWERQDIDLLMDHVRGDDRIDISLHGEYAYSVDRQDYYDMTRDAMDNVRTASFEFYNVRWHDGREAVAYAKHVYYDGSDDQDYGNLRTVYLKYRLEKRADEWNITEVGTSPDELY